MNTEKLFTYHSKLKKRLDCFYTETCKFSDIEPQYLDYDAVEKQLGAFKEEINENVETIVNDILAQIKSAHRWG